jgi:glyoxylase-like metal-dependent hydrolase (beta-lactamase superfamily II)/rhodanese-related sulfurtransferase
MNDHLLFKQLYDQTSGTYTYLLADKVSGQAVLIDSVFEQHNRDYSLIQELELSLIACLETHCHADHVTGAWLLKHRTNCQIAASADSGIDLLDISMSQGDEISFGSFALKVIATPGHTDGCVSYMLNDQSMVFTGDTLLIRGCGRTDFQQGSASKLYHSIKELLFALPDACNVFPAHDYAGRTSSTIGEEKRHNPRIGGQANETDFVGFMENMNLPHPKQLDFAVPANLKAGKPDDDKLPRTPPWAPVTTTYSGVLEVAPEWVAASLDAVHVLDVRTQAEIEEENTQIEGAQHIPIDQLRARLDEVPTDKPVMTICRSGKRSVLAFNLLQQVGRDEIANINGGFLRWYAEGLPTN